MDNRPLYVIGDIHGEYRKLKIVMDKIILDSNQVESVICFLGDYVDRGPDSKKVIDYFLYELPLINHLKPVFLLGNHEQMMDFDSALDPLSAREEWVINGGNDTLKSYGGVIPDEHMSFIKNLQMMYTHDFSNRKIICVHAGIDPGKALDDQTETQMIWSRKFVDYNGEYPENAFVVFGHTPDFKPNKKNNHVGIDTGACFRGGFLTCVKFVNGSIQKLFDSKTAEFWN